MTRVRAFGRSQCLAAGACPLGGITAGSVEG